MFYIIIIVKGYVDPERVREVSTMLLEKGCYEVSLGDTIGVATPGAIASVLKGRSILKSQCKLRKLK